MGVALPWQWFAQPCGISKDQSQLLSYFLSPLVALCAVAAIHVTSLGNHCLFEHLLGIPCPGCGITTSLFAILTGNLVAAWSANPCGFLVFASLLGQSLVTALEYFSVLDRGARLDFALHSNSVVASFLIIAWMAHLIRP